MSSFLLVSSLLLLFLGLGVSADVMIANVRVLGQRLRISTFALGLMLGTLTSLPEFFVGLNASIKGIAQISFGNLMGGTMVLLGLIAGFSIIASESIQTSHLFKTKWLILMGGFILLPMIFVVDGSLSTVEGVLMAVVYFLIINGMFNEKTEEEQSSRSDETHSGISTKKALFFSFAGVIGIVFFSHFIIETTLALASQFALPLFFTGLIVFSLGTNLPELTVAVIAWRKGIKKLSLGHILGSAFTNPLVAAILVIFRPINIRTSLSFWVFFALLFLMVILYVYFGLSGHKFTRREGIILVGVYVLFLLSQIGCLFLTSHQVCLR